MMNEKELLKIVTGFRKGILGRKKPNMMCAAVTWPLHTFLDFSGVKTKMIRYAVQEHNFKAVWEHWCLIRPDGTIIDATASQFKKPDGTQMPAVYIGPKPSWYIAYRETKKNPQRIARGLR